MQKIEKLETGLQTLYHKASLAKLQQFASQPMKDDLDKAGLIQGFEFTFEQCWKALQKAGGNEGVRIASPKSAFSWAMEQGWKSVQGRCNCGTVQFELTFPTEMCSHCHCESCRRSHGAVFVNGSQFSALTQII